MTEPCQHSYHTVGSNSVCRFCDLLEHYDEKQVELRLAEDRTMTAAWDELQALLDANEQRHLLAAGDPYRIPEDHTFEAEQWAAVRRLLSLACGDEPTADCPGNPADTL